MPVGEHVSLLTCVKVLSKLMGINDHDLPQRDPLPAPCAWAPFQPSPGQLLCKYDCFQP